MLDLSLRAMSMIGIVLKKVVVIYTTAGVHSDINRLFTRQPFPIPNALYTRLPCIQYKIVIYTAAVSHIKLFIYTTAGHPVSRRYLHGSRFSYQNIYIHGCRASSVQTLFTRQPFPIQKLYIHGCRATSIKSLGQRHVILSPIDAHYKWPPNKIYSHVS